MEVGRLNMLSNLIFLLCASEMMLVLNYLNRYADTEKNIYQLLAEGFTGN
jgi:hypothetical protein